MKRIISLFLIAFFSFCKVCLSQNPTYQQKLYYTCKVWGFVKYFHSNVSTCGVNWDSVLLHCLPLVKNAITDSEFNDALDTMLLAAGPMMLTLSPPCDTMAPELKRNLNFGWISNPLLRADVQTILDTIKNNFRPHPECWINTYRTGHSPSYLYFPYDGIIYNADDNSNFADEGHRLLELFVHWNIINYFNPYNYTHDQPWDSTLFQNVIRIDTTSNDASFYNSFLRITHDMNDAHVQGFTFDNYSFCPLKGLNSPNIVLKHIPNKYIVVKSGVSGINPGDEILAVNGLTTKQWEDSLAPYLSYGDSASFYEMIQEFIIMNASGASITLTYSDSLNTTHSIVEICNAYLPYRAYYPNDTLANVQWKYWSDCNIGYVNVGKMPDVGSDVANMYSALQNTNAIIFDIRNYPASSAVWTFADSYLYPNPIITQKSMEPDTAYPGTFYWQNDFDWSGNSNYYRGKIIVLFDEQTISEAESMCMVLGEWTNAVKIGSQTDGTDGAVTNYSLSRKMATGFTTEGVFYPNGNPTERIGIIPDSIVYPTQAGIRHNRDEVLEKALQVAGCNLAVPSIESNNTLINIYPNPNCGKFTLEYSTLSVKAGIEVFNALGEIVYKADLHSSETEINLEEKPSGVYLYRVISKTGEIISTGKFIIN